MGRRGERLQRGSRGSRQLGEAEWGELTLYHPRLSGEPANVQSRISVAQVPLKGPHCLPSWLPWNHVSYTCDLRQHCSNLRSEPFICFPQGWMLPQAASGVAPCLQGLPKTDGSVLWSFHPCACFSYILENRLQPDGT